MSEKPVEDAFVSCIERRGGLALKFEVKGQNGFPDRIGLLPGARVLFCEAKDVGEEPRKLQRKRHRDLRRLGFSVCVPRTPEAARRAVAEFDARTR